MGLGKFIRARKAVSASRASLNGIAGHKAAMNALGNASLSTNARLVGQEPHPTVKTAMGDSYERESMPSAFLHVLGQSKPEYGQIVAATAKLDQKLEDIIKAAVIIVKENLA